MTGQNYKKLKRCICISILGFNLDDRPEYHRVYRLRDEMGYVFSDMLEIHVIELNKPLSGSGRMDEWIQLFNENTEEELNMLQTNTKNLGILEAIKEVRVMSLGRTFKLLYDGHMKQIRDRDAREDFVRNEGREQGLEQGLQKGEDKLSRLTLKLIAERRYEDIERAARDKEYREQLYREYKI